MYSTGEAYKRAVRADERKVVPYISLGVGFDPTAADDLSTVEYDGLPLSNPAQVIDANYVMTPGLATFEDDGIPTAAGSGMIAPPIQPVAYPPEAGIWSHDISDADGLIDWTVDIRLTQAHTSAFSIYTDTVHILEGKLTYYNGGAVVRETTIETTMDKFQDTEITTYDRIVFQSIKIDKPYHHIRIVEIEFGASLTLSNTVLGDTLTLLSEYDPLGISAPVYELDFSLLNVEGEYDQDNPDSLLPQVEKWLPLTFALTIITDEGQTSIPMGRFYITDRSGTDTLLKVTAQDARAILQSTFTPITLNTEQSLGLMFETMLTDLGIPYVIDDSVYQIMPDNNITLDDQERDLLTQALYIQQYYGVYLIPGRDNNLHVTTDDTGDTFPAIDAEGVISYPTPTTAKTYNYIAVSYKEGQTTKTFTIDLRENETDARSALQLSNPLVMDATNAERLARDLQTRIYGQLYDMEVFGDASMDPRDTVPIEGRWTQRNPDSFRITSIEWKYDGAFLMTLKGVK